MHMQFVLCFIAHKQGYFTNEIEPVEVKIKKGIEMFGSDEHPRETDLVELAKLPSVFKTNGLVTAGNASVSCISYIVMSLPWVAAVAFNIIFPQQ